MVANSMVAKPANTANTNDQVVSTYRQIVTDLEARGIMPDKAPSLLPMQKALEKLVPPNHFRPERTIVVAGTNGKGSVCATLESLFLAAGETVGLYTSPHLEETTERIRINGKEISQELFCRAYLAVSNKTHDIPLTHFEVLTAMAAWIFFSGEAIPPVQHPIFEVGLGGIWDATNAIPHRNCIITSLGYDHQNLLGNSLEEIATNKFGIVQQGATVVHSKFPSEARESILKLSKAVQVATGSQWIESVPFESLTADLTVEMNSGSSLDFSSNEPQFLIKTQWGRTPLSLAGERGAQNTATALTFFAQLGYNPSDYLSVLNQIQWPGRMEKHKGAKPCPTYSSGDHNSQGAKSLVQLLKYYKRKHLYILVGVGRDKDLDGILAPLFSLKDASDDTSIFLTETPFKGRSVEDYGKWRNLASGASKDSVGMLRKIQTLACPEDMILVTGSLYLVGYLRSKI
jgi:dihydrofolate synthase/folylpolyglutamate synthase